MGSMTVRGYVGLLLFIPVSLSLGADPLDQWQWRNPLPSANCLFAVTYANGIFVAVGDGETVMTSPDGIQWTTQHSGSGFGLHGIAYGQGTFVAVGTYHPQVEGFGRSDGEWNMSDSAVNFSVRNGTTSFGAVMTSPDGTNWTSQDIQLDTSAIESVTYGDGLFAAVGMPQQLSDATNTPSLILTSPDGLHWTPTGVFVEGWMTGVAYGNGRFLAAGQDLGGPQSGVLVTSTDGIHWSGPNLVSTQVFWGLCFGQGVFVGVGPGFAGAGGVTISTNGQTWTVVAPGVLLNSVEYANGLFVAVGDQGRLLTSTDALQWTSVASGTSQGLKGAAWGNGRFVVVGEGALLASDNGQAWTNLWSGIPNYALLDVAYGNGQFVACPRLDFDSFGGFLTSTDGVNWAKVPVEGSNVLWRIVYGGGRFVGVGGNGAVWSSTDGLSWNNVVSGSSRFLRDVCYTGDAYVAVGGSGILRGSADASNWVDYDLGTSYLAAVAYGNGLCVAATWDGNILRSTNGVDWVYQSLTNLNLGDADLKSIAFGNGVFVAVGDGIVIYSVDAVNWNAVHLNAFLNRVCYGEGMFVAVDNYGQILSSVDGKLWAPHPSGTAICLYGIACGGGSFVAVGVEEAAILQSGNLHATPVPFLLTPPQFRPDGTIALAINGLTGTNVQVLGSADLGQWQAITNLPVTGPSMQIILPKPSDVQWFYRAAQSQ